MGAQAPGAPADANHAVDTPPVDSLVERLVRRDRIAAGAGVVVVASLAWAHLLGMAGHDPAMDTGMGAGMAMPHLQAWGAADLGLLVVMWAVMMVAMMLPSAAPFVLLFASIVRRRRERRSSAAPTTALVAGYLVAWTAFAAAAGLAQWGLHRAALISPATATAGPVLGGLLLVVAGLYQWTPLKGRCLSECRSPLGFLTREWREGSLGALAMGVRHGAFCVGC
ncbi:MAG TPA: DUF2182 domain-containing protein, partial [Gemmatimonadaceae bacterium]|nr:DUF2182 domain-containing protein [Gemmatimonadaceae bacterium]